MKCIFCSKLSLILLLINLCICSTGCLRLTNHAIGAAMSSMGPHAYHSTSPKFYFYGTNLCIREITTPTPLAPVAVIDFPLELALDLLILPGQCLDAKNINQWQKEYFSHLSLGELAYGGYKSEFRRRLNELPPDQLNHQNIVEGILSESFNDQRRLRPCFKILFQKDPRFIKAFLCSEKCMDRDNDIILLYILLHNLHKQASEEYAVFLYIGYNNVENNMLVLVKTMLKKGCDPNAIPPFQDKLKESIRGKSALDIVQDILEQSIKKGPNKFTAEYNHQLEQLIKLLKVHGAKTAKELGQ